MDSRPPKRSYATFLADFIEPVHPLVPRTSTSLHSFVSEWLESVGSDRPKRRCRSSSPLHDGSKNGPVLRQPARSLPDMDMASNMRDADGFVVPSLPASIASRSAPVDADLGASTPSEISRRSSAKSLVEDPFYRVLNLSTNGIHLRDINEEYPDQIADLVRDVGKERSSPGPSPDEVRNDAALHKLETNGGEPDVEEYFRNHVYPYSEPTGALQRSDRQPISKHAVPATGSKFRVSNPIPDMLYGYSRNAFSQQNAQLASMGVEPVANNQGLIYPFFIVEFKGDGPAGAGSLWVATNQCLGGSASCVNVTERLNRQLRHGKNDMVRPINSAVFSVAMTGTEARLYISWKHNDLEYHTRKVRGFLLQDPDHYIEFRKHVSNILDWGKDKRLDDIRQALDHLQKESKKTTSQAAKARPSPSTSASSSSAKKQKPSPSRRNSLQSNSAQAPSEPDPDTYWKWDETVAKWYHVCRDGSITWGQQNEDSTPAGFVRY
ncbi:hypothetical protein B0T22DRAFT_294968 [Podospora appendiculata]|uniref:DUF7924 domain-containing protein n=1 Tax=Podospora appendiculata TaxID=314037 RepID=A0AAE1C8J1_9PEZI|nr:hypothetical protein B0T22DRAFT_294968 [Podospora appendiculata]